MRQGLHILFVVIILFNFSHLSSQTTPTPNSLDEQYTPQANILFKESPGRSAYASDIDLSVGVKVLPFELVRGNFMMETEIAVMQDNSILFGIGYNFMADRALSNFHSTQLPIDSYTSLSFDIVFANSTYKKGGICFAFSYRNYVEKFKIRTFGYTYEKEGKAMNDWYRSITFKYNVQNLELDTVRVYSRGKVVGDNNVSLKSFWLLSGIGYSTIKEGRVKTVHDFYCSFGIRMVRYTNFNFVQNYNPNTNQVTEYYSSTGKDRIHLLFPAIHLGYSLGIGF